MHIAPQKRSRANWPLRPHLHATHIVAVGHPQAIVQQYVYCPSTPFSHTLLSLGVGCWYTIVLGP